MGGVVEKNGEWRDVRGRDVFVKESGEWRGVRGVSVEEVRGVKGCEGEVKHAQATAFEC